MTYNDDVIVLIVMLKFCNIKSNLTTTFVTPYCCEYYETWFCLPIFETQRSIKADIMASISGISRVDDSHPMLRRRSTVTWQGAEVSYHALTYFVDVPVHSAKCVHERKQILKNVR